MTYHEPCPRCGGVLRRLDSTELGDDEQLRCERCGHEVYVHAIPDLSAFREENEWQRYRAIVRFAAPPSTDEIAALRKLSAWLAARPLPAVWSEARANNALAIAEDYIGPVRNLQEQAHNAGIDVEIEPIGD